MDKEGSERKAGALGICESTFAVESLIMRT